MGDGGGERGISVHLIFASAQFLGLWSFATDLPIRLYNTRVHQNVIFDVPLSAGMLI
jgi:hypothetical protein